jgi:hypothetical protein
MDGVPICTVNKSIQKYFFEYFYELFNYYSNGLEIIFNGKTEIAY